MSGCYLSVTFVWLKYFSSAMYFYNFSALHSIIQGLVSKEVKSGFHLLLLFISVPPSSVQNKLQACDVTSLLSSCCLLKKPRHSPDLHSLKINKLLVRQGNLFVLMTNKEVNVPNAE